MEIINKLFVILLVFCMSFYNCSENNDLNSNSKILLIVENSIYENLQFEIEQLIVDIENEGHEVLLNHEISKSSLPIDIRRLLQKDFNKDQRLIGSIFIGNIAAPLYNKKEDQGDAYWHDYLADFYYMDLDGIWEDQDDNGVFDNHKDSKSELWSKIRKKLNIGDNRTPEIWVSRIRADKLTALGDEISLLKAYFKKNHEYRTGQMPLPPKRAFVISDGVNLSKSDWGAYPSKIYKDIYSDKIHPFLGDTLRNILKSNEGYEWGVINVFSGPRIHHFNIFNDRLNPDWWKSSDGRKLIAEHSDQINDSTDVSWKDIKSIQPKVLFYHLLTSEVGRHDYNDYLGGMYLFSGLGLAAIAGTQHSGSVGTSVLYDELANGNSIGQAWKRALVYLVENSEKRISIYYYPDSEEKLNAGKSNYKAVLLGDGTLKLPTR